jgi:hypothetical protein
VEVGSSAQAGPSRFGIEWLLRCEPVTVAAGVLGISIVKYGLGLYPSWRYLLELAQNWRHPLVAPLFQIVHQRFLLDSPTSAVLAGVLHLTSERGFIAFHLLLACAAIMAPFGMRAVRRSAELRLTLALLLIGGAVPPMLLDWVGSYDPVSIAAGAVAALSSNPIARAAAWAVFAFNDAPEAAVAGGVFALVLWADNGRAELPRILSCFAGGVAGYVAIRIVTSAWGGGQSEFTMMKYYGFHEYLLGYGYLPLVALAALGVGWLFLAARDVRSLRPVRWLLGLSVCVVLGVPLIALDTSRIAAGSLWPALLVVTMIVISKLGVERSRALLARIAPVALLLVIVLAWNVFLTYPGWA